MSLYETATCEEVAPLVLSEEWRHRAGLDRKRGHIENCPHCQERVKEVSFFGRVFSDSAQVFGSQVVKPPHPVVRDHERTGGTVVDLQSSRLRSILLTTAKVALWAVAACLVVYFVSSTLADKGIGEVSYSEGVVFCQRMGASGEETLRKGDRIRAGDVIRTGDDGHAVLAMEDANALFMNPETILKMESKRQIHHRAGQMWAEIRQGKGEFEVETRGADVLVLGTSFGIEYMGETVSIQVTKGRVKVITKGGAVEIEPGESAQYSSTLPYLPPTKTARDENPRSPNWVQRLDRESER